MSGSTRTVEVFTKAAARLRQALAPPAFADNEKTQRAALMHTILVATLSLTVFTILLGRLFPATRIGPYFPLSIVLVIAMVALLRVLHNGYLNVAAVGLCGAGVIYTTYAVFRLSGVQDPGYAGAVIIIIIAASVIGWRAAVALTLTFIVIGVLGVETEEDFNIWLAMGATFIIALTVQLLINDSAHKAMSRAGRDEEALRASEARYRSLLDLSSLGIAVTHLTDNTIVYINPAGARLLGANNPQQLLGLNSRDFIAPDDVGVFDSRRGTMRSGQDAPYAEYRFRRMDGTNFPCVVGSTIIDYKGQPSALSVFTDITERKQMEDALRASEARYRLLLEVSPVAVVVYTAPDFLITYANAAAAQLLGADNSDELLGHKAADFVVPVDRDQLEVRFAELNQGKPLAPVEYHVNRFDGTSTVVEVGSVMITYEGQQAIMAVITDVTERKAIEAERLKADVLGLELERERRLAQLRESFVSMMSHEFRTPLTVVLSSKELLERYQDRMTEEQRGTHFSRMGQQIKFMVAMLDDILTLSKASAGVLEFNPAPVNLDVLCHEIADEQLLAAGEDRRISIHIGGNCEPVQGDERLLHHIISNLLGNAVKYSPDDSTIELTLDCSGTQGVTITVRDHGIGIPPEDRERIFQPFVRAGNAGELKGTGLGLAIVRHCVDLHGGTIACDDAPGGGTLFTIRLPLPPAAHPSIQPPPANPTNATFT